MRYVKGEKREVQLPKDHYVKDMSFDEENNDQLREYFKYKHFMEADTISDRKLKFSPKLEEAR